MTVVAALWAATTACAQQPFDLDPSFRTEIEQIYVSSIALMSNGKVLASGWFRYPTDEPFIDRAIGRLNADGSQDADYPYVGAGGGEIKGWGNKFYVESGQTVRRLTAEGLLDTTFPHMNSTAQFTSGQGGDFHVYPDGSVLIAGWHTLNMPEQGWVGDYELIWFTNEGLVDVTRTPRTGNGVIYEMEEQPDGKFLLSGPGNIWEG